MDSEVQRDGRILDLIDDAWREDKLPYEDVAIPLVGGALRGGPRPPSGGAHAAGLSQKLLGWPRLAPALPAASPCPGQLPYPGWGAFPPHTSGSGTTEEQDCPFSVRFLHAGSAG